MSTQNKISVIVPLYNGYAFFKDCFESIIRNTAKETYELIIINDASSELKLLNYLDEIKKDHGENIIILNNKRNLGFIGSINRGIKFSKYDVLLLNSDTVVTKNWLEKISKCAYTSRSIGTVTPLSNNAALVSFPNQWEDNEIPKGHTLESISDLIEKSSLHLYPEIPSPVGFCMYIKREVIKKIGLFDTIYGKGYGEENDFGMRAYRIGYKHVLDDSTYILHKGSMSFKHYDKKRELIKKNSAILHRRYPELNRMLIDFENEKPLFPIYNNIKFNIETNMMSKKGILFVSVAEVDNFPSGALLHTKNLIENTGEQFNKYLVYRDNNSIVLVLYCKNNEKIRYIFDFNENFHLNNFDHQEIEFIWKLILENFNIKIVHFQTPQELPLSLFSLSKKLKKEVYFTAHDFFLYCPSFVLTRYNSEKNTHEFCNYETNESVCRNCLHYKMGLTGLPTNFQALRRQYIKKNVLSNIDKIFFPSAFARNATMKLFPNERLEEKSFVIPHGTELKRSSSTISETDNLNIAYIGSFSEIKGSKIFSCIAKNFSNNPRINFFVIGKVEDNDSALLIKRLRNTHLLGQYKKNDLEKIIKRNKINLSLILSICPETFGLTISESWANNVPVVVLGIGAQQERVSKTGAGWIVDILNPEQEIKKILNDILADSNVLLEKIRKIPKTKSEKENAKEYENFYRNVSAVNNNLSSKKIFKFIQKTDSYKSPKKRFSFDRTRIKHIAFVCLSKLGLVNVVRPIYYKYKNKVEMIITLLFE